MGSRFSINSSVSPSTSPRSSNRPPSPTLESPSDVTFYYRSKPFWTYYDDWLSSKEGTYLLFTYSNESIRQRLYQSRNKEEICSLLLYFHHMISQRIQQVHQDKTSRHPMVYWKQHYSGQTWPEYNTAISNYRLFDSAGYFYQTCSDLLRYIPYELRKSSSCHKEATDESIYYSKLSRCCYTLSRQYSNCAVVIEKLSQSQHSSLVQRLERCSAEEIQEKHSLFFQELQN